MVPAFVALLLVGGCRSVPARVAGTSTIQAALGSSQELTFRIRLPDGRVALRDAQVSRGTTATDELPLAVKGYSDGRLRLEIRSEGGGLDYSVAWSGVRQPVPDVKAREIVFYKAVEARVRLPVTERDAVRGRVPAVPGRELLLGEVPLPRGRIRITLYSGSYDAEPPDLPAPLRVTVPAPKPWPAHGGAENAAGRERRTFLVPRSRTGAVRFDSTISQAEISDFDVRVDMGITRATPMVGNVTVGFAGTVTPRSKGWSLRWTRSSITDVTKFETTLAGGMVPAVIFLPRVASAEGEVALGPLFTEPRTVALGPKEDMEIRIDRVRGTDREHSGREPEREREGREQVGRHGAVGLRRAGPESPHECEGTGDVLSFGPPRRP